MTYDIFGSKKTVTELKVFTVPENIILPEGNSEETAATDSVKLILPSSTTERKCFLYNTGVDEVRLFFGGEASTWEADPRSPIRISPGEYSLIESDIAKMAIYGWSMGGSVIMPATFTV